jgi:sulfoxide reductase catalytic subunit YedY
MLLRKQPDLTYADVTPKAEYFGRREFLRALGITGALALGGKGLPELIVPAAAAAATTKLSGVIKGPFGTDEKQTPYKDVTTYNNFYEFGTDKSDPARNAQNFRTSPWSVSVEGEVKKPRKFSIEELLKLAPLEERIYRHRCVEGWSIVVPWIGYSFNVLAKLVEPTAKAKFVAFESLYDPAQMPQGKYAGIPFPYVEGLRIDEAMNPLALLCTGMYGETLPNQDGAPVRLVLPWKYGYKSIKSLVKIRFQETQPPTTWNRAWSAAYGFYSNVIPTAENPFRNQSSERRLGDYFPRKTLVFNGYGDQVANLYSGMDPNKIY